MTRVIVRGTHRTVDSMKLSGKVVVWPANLDSSKSRVEGRKLAKAQAVQSPKLDEIDAAAKNLSLEAELVSGKSRPSAWWERGGYFIIAKRNTRPDILRSLAGEIKRMRADIPAREKEKK